MVRAASGTPFLPANPVASTRLDGLLVRTTLSNPVRKNRGATERQNHLPAKARAPKNRPDHKHRTLPEVEGLLE